MIWINLRTVSAMEDLTKLLQVLSEDTGVGDLSLRLRSDDSAKAGLQVFYSILREGVDVISNEDSRSGLELWTDAQIQAVLSIAFPVVMATRSLAGRYPCPLISSGIRWWVDDVQFGCVFGLIEAKISC